MAFTDGVVVADNNSYHRRRVSNVPTSPKRVTEQHSTHSAGDDQYFPGDIDDDQSRRSIRSIRSVESEGNDELSPRSSSSTKSKTNSSRQGATDHKTPFRKTNSRRCINYDIEELLNDDSNRPMFGASRSVCSTGSKQSKDGSNAITKSASCHSRFSGVDFDWGDNETIRCSDRSIGSIGAGSQNQIENSSVTSTRRIKQLEASSCHRRSVDFDLEDWMNENGVPVLHFEEPLQGEPTDYNSEPLSSHSEPLSNSSEPLRNNSERLDRSRSLLDDNIEPQHQGRVYDIETLSLKSASSHSSNRSVGTPNSRPKFGACGSGNKKIQVQIMAALRQAVAKTEKTEETKLDTQELWGENDLLLVDNFNKDEEEDIRYWKDRLEREEIYLHQYQPSQRERQEVQHLAHFLGIQDLVRTSTAAKTLWAASLQRVADHAILTRLHVHTRKLRQVSNEARRLGVLFHPSSDHPISIVLKRGPVFFQNEKRELIFLTHGFVVAKLPFLESVNAAIEVPVAETQPSRAYPTSPQPAFIPKMLSKIAQKETNPQQKIEAAVRNHDVCRFWTNVRTMKAVEDDPLSFSIVLNNDDTNNFANDEVQHTFTCQSELQAEAWLTALNQVIIRAYTNSATASMAAYFACCDDLEDIGCVDEHEREPDAEEGNSSMNSIELEEDEIKQPPKASSPLSKKNPFQKAMTAFQHGGSRFQTFLASRDPSVVVGKQRGSVADTQQAETSTTEGVPFDFIKKPPDAIADSVRTKKIADEAENCAVDKAKKIFQNALTVLQDRSTRNLMSSSEQPALRDQKKLVHKLRDKATKQRFLHP